MRVCSVAPDLLYCDFASEVLAPNTSKLLIDLFCGCESLSNCSAITFSFYIQVAVVLLPGHIVHFERHACKIVNVIGCRVAHAIYCK